ncbi:uncharacterized protein LOC135943093 [Cloeon dipterum]|uniref:uncharacterized protein LOC135943093 n=1 Tax=Cloeon dipterum TaxID=197152 RepID=UPI00321FF96B
MRIWMIILAHSVLMACASRSVFSSKEKKNISKVKRHMRGIFDFFDQTDQKEFLLILGDTDGESGELSLFLTGNRNNQTELPTKRRDLPFFTVDNQTGVLVIDLPYFDTAFHNVYIDLMKAFTHKLIFEKAKALRILLVMPDKGKKDIIRFSKLAVKLVAILDENFMDISSTITIVGAIKPKTSKEKVMTMLKDVVETLQDDMGFMNDTLSETYGNKSEDADWIQKKLWWTKELMYTIDEEDLYSGFRRPGKNGAFWSEENRKNLRKLFFKTGDYASAHGRFEIIVNRKTKDYISNIDTSVFVKRGLLRRFTQLIVSAVLDIEFSSENAAHLDMLRSSEHNINKRTQNHLFYDGYVSKFKSFDDKNLEDYCLKAELGANVWSTFKFELETLEFFEKMIGKYSTINDYDLRNLLVNEVEKHRKLAVRLF